MKAVILGSGSVAETLAGAIAARGDLVQIYGRGTSAGDLARSLGVPYTSSPEDLATADIYIMAVSDGAIAELSSRLRVPEGAVVAHTAGGVDINAISPHIADRAVLYPLQTFTKGLRVALDSVPIFVEYTTPHAREVVKRMAKLLSGNFIEADSARRLRIHTAAVFACNFVNHLYGLGGRLLEEDGLSPSLLNPLIMDTAVKAVFSGDPAAVQTGPAVRGDSETMRRHVELLASEGKITYEKIYELLSQSIWETSKKI